MNEWKELTLGDLLTLQRGYDLTQTEVSPGSYPVISSGGVSYSTDVPKVPGPGVVTGRKGVLGKVHYSEGPYWPHDTTLWVKDFKGSNPRFVYYLLQTLPLAGLDVGAANPSLNRNHAHLLPVRVPGRTGQGRISAVLGAFDDLIENKSRRVEVLEEMARAIYREWFVHFRFPGHEDATFVDSYLGPVPRGWFVVQLGSIAELQGGSTTTKKDYVSSGFRAYSASGPDGHLPRHEFSGKGVVLSAVGARCGRTFRASGKWSSIANTIKILPSQDRCSPAWLSLTLEDASIFPKRGSAQPFISINDARGVLLVAPDAATMEEFERIAGPLFELVDILNSASERLTSARDMLLPKLVSGQIDVSDLDLDAVMAQAGV